jgi:hypothetical protein
VHTQKHQRIQGVKELVTSPFEDTKTHIKHAACREHVKIVSHVYGCACSVIAVPENKYHRAEHTGPITYAWRIQQLSAIRCSKKDNNPCGPDMSAASSMP